MTWLTKEPFIPTSRLARGDLRSVNQKAVKRGYLLLNNAESGIEYVPLEESDFPAYVLAIKNSFFSNQTSPTPSHPSDISLSLQGRKIKSQGLP